PGQVSIPEGYVPTPGRDVVDQSVDRHLRGGPCRCLSIGGGNHQRDDDENGGDDSEELTHNCLLMWKVNSVQRSTSEKRSNTNTCAHQERREGFTPGLRKGQAKTGRSLPTVPQGPEPLGGRLAERRLRREVPDTAEGGFGFVPSVLGGEQKPQVVVGSLLLGIETDGKSQRFLGL